MKFRFFSLLTLVMLASLCSASASESIPGVFRNGKSPDTQLETIQTELHIRYTFDGKTEEELFDDQNINPEQIEEFEKVITVVLSGVQDDNLKIFLAEKLGCSPDMIKITERFCHEIHFYTDSACKLYKRFLKNGKMMLQEIPWRKTADTDQNIDCVKLYATAMIGSTSIQTVRVGNFATAEEASTYQKMIEANPWKDFWYNVWLETIKRDYPNHQVTVKFSTKVSK